jgi:hypothetical protein
VDLNGLPYQEVWARLAHWALLLDQLVKTLRKASRLKNNETVRIFSHLHKTFVAKYAAAARFL